ncbi:MAG TPA: BREX system ATP-binding domain-containing protein, partial [Anaeromyxobacter sp.]
MGETISAVATGDAGGRYRATRLLKRSLGVETYLGTDPQSGDAVVVKRMAAAEISPGAQLRLEHEAEALRWHQAPWIAPLLDVGREGDVFFLVTRLVPGSTLAERLAKAGPLPVPDALAVGRALLRALSVAHEHGVLHRDVKPSNVMVDEGSPPQCVTLVDFGIARTELDASLRQVPAAAAAYVSPEQSGLVHAEVGERSDLYSAGVVLYECLSGRPPFEGATVGEVLRQHLSTKARSLGEAVPRALDRVVQRLLEKDPRERYQSAAAALADLDEIASALEQGVREPAVAVGTHDRRSTLTESAFVGREKELRSFEAELDRAFAGESRLLLVEGESGAGKTRMLDHAAVSARRRGAWVLRGQGADRAAQRPLQVFDRVVDEIVQATAGDPQFADALRGRLGDHLETLCRALPRLLDLLAPGMLVSLGPEAHGEARALPALIALLDALGSPARPAVILLDDCQWLDELSLKLLAAWHRAHRSSSQRGGVLLVAAYRTDDVARDSPLLQLAPAERIALSPFTEEEVARMAESMTGALPPEALALVVRLSEGNPFLAAAVVTGLVESGALVATDRGWELDPQAMRDAQSSHRAAAFLAQRLDKVSPSSLELLSVGAVLGKSFPVKLAADLAGQTRAAAMAAVAEARRRHLLWIASPDGRCVFVHDRLREAVLQRLAPDERVRLHRLAAMTLEMDPEQMEGLIANYYEYHFLYIGGIHHVESKNVQGVSLMKLYFHPGTDMAQA